MTRLALSVASLLALCSMSGCGLLVAEEPSVPPAPISSAIDSAPAMPSCREKADFESVDDTWVASDLQAAFGEPAAPAMEVESQYVLNYITCGGDDVGIVLFHANGAATPATPGDKVMSVLWVPVDF